MPISGADFKAAAAKRRKTADVDLDGLGTVRIRALSAGDAQRFQSEVKKAGHDAEAMAFTLIARSWINEDGEPLFEEAEGVAVAQSLDPADYNALAKAVLTLNGLNEKAVDDALKNSETSAAVPMPTDSPESSDTPTST